MSTGLEMMGAGGAPDNKWPMTGGLLGEGWPLEKNL